MKRMISTKAATVAESIKDYIKQNDKTTEFGGNVEIDGDLIVNGKAPGGGATIYKHALTIQGFSQNFFAVFYSSKATNVTSLDNLKTLLGSTFKLPTSGAISSGAVGSGYYIAIYLDENGLQVANTTEIKTIPFNAINLTDSVSEI